MSAYLGIEQDVLRLEVAARCSADRETRETSAAPVSKHLVLPVYRQVPVWGRG
jgi:hypothetical protein